MKTRLLLPVFALLSLACLVSLGCKNEKAEKRADKKATALAEPSASDTSSTKKPSTAKPTVKITKKLAQALVDDWLQAQTSGDLAGYSKLYASKFTGVKRVGPKQTRFDRASWVKDRARMFRKPMKVEANDIAIAVTATTATARFTQRWASGTFEDVGPKRLLMVAEGSRLRIAQEEMLRSELVATQRDDDFYLLHERGMLLPDAPVPEVTSAPEVDLEESIYSAFVKLKENELSPALRAWKGKKVRVDGACEATVEGFGVLSRVIPHFGTVQEWDCTYADPGCVPATDADRGVSVFASGTQIVVAELSDCDGTYARSIDSKRAILGTKTAMPDVEKKARVAFGKLKDVTAQSSPGNETWWRGIESVAIYRHPNSGETLVSVAAQTGDYCGEFSASSWQLWRLEAGKLVELAHGNAPIEIENGH